MRVEVSKRKGIKLDEGVGDKKRTRKRKRKKKVRLRDKRERERERERETQLGKFGFSLFGFSVLWRGAVAYVSHTRGLAGAHDIR